VRKGSEGVKKSETKNRFHAKAQSARSWQRKQTISILRSFATWGLSVNIP
jgi:hypothetical protein